MGPSLPAQQVRDGSAEPAAVDSRVMSYQRPPEHYVRHSMTTELLTAGPDDTLVGAAARMNQRRVGAVLVVDDRGLAGILTERDVLRAVAHGTIDGLVRDWMTPDPVTVGPD